MLNDPSKLARFSLRNGTRAGPTAAVERAHSDRARSGSKGSARVSFHSFHRARSASKEGTWPLPPHPSEGVRSGAIIPPLMHNSIVIKGAREHNLKNIDVTIPRDQLVPITDWRGWGRRSLPE